MEKNTWENERNPSKAQIQHLLKQDLHFGFHPPYVQGFSCAPETSGSLDKFLSKEHHTLW
jgi:hypothetical protein